MGKKFDVVAVVGKYKDRDGNDKSRYQNIGAVFENDKGQLSLKLECIPVGPEWIGWANLFEPKSAEQSTHGKAAPSVDDEIPF